MHIVAGGFAAGPSFPVVPATAHFMVAGKHRWRHIVAKRFRAAAIWRAIQVGVDPLTGRWQASGRAINRVPEMQSLERRSLLSAGTGMPYSASTYHATTLSTSLQASKTSPQNSRQTNLVSNANYLFQDLASGKTPTGSLAAALAKAKASGPPIAEPLIEPDFGPGKDGWTPQQIINAYGVDDIDGDGAGQTIAIVDAYNNPYIQSDLAAFDGKFGLPGANLTVLNQEGQTSPLPAPNSGWAIEEDLDVEWAHAIAPGANLVLVEADGVASVDISGIVDGEVPDLITAINTA